MKFTIDIDDSEVPMSDGDAAAAGAWLDMTLRDNGYTVAGITWRRDDPTPETGEVFGPQFKLIIKPRQAGKTWDVLALAAQHFAYIICPTRQDVNRLWRTARERDLNMPQPITFGEFSGYRYGAKGVKAFIIDDLDRCLQSMTPVPIIAASLTGNTGEPEPAVMYRVWYWDPCNGMGGSSEDKGLFATRPLAEAFINDKVGEPGSPRRLDPNNWDRDAYRIQEVPVIRSVAGRDKRERAAGEAGKRVGSTLHEGLIVTTSEVFRYVAANSGIQLLDLIQAYQRNGVEREVIASTLIDMLATGALTVDFLGRVTLPGVSVK